MAPAARRTTLIRLLAQIDQQISETESFATSTMLDPDEREYAAAQLNFRRKSVEWVERMLALTTPSRER